MLQNLLERCQGWSWNRGGLWAVGQCLSKMVFLTCTMLPTRFPKDFPAKYKSSSYISSTLCSEGPRTILVHCRIYFSLNRNHYSDMKLNVWRER